MSDEYADAFEELLDAQEEARGYRPTVNIDGEEIDAVIEDLVFDPTHLMGGDGNKGGFMAICPVARFNASPKQGASITAEGYGDGLTILKVRLRNGVTYEITAGDAVAANEGGMYE